MKRRMKRRPMILLAIAAVLLVASTVGSTQAALVYYSENYSAEVTVSNIGISLVENGDVINYRNYLSDGNWDKLADKAVLMEDLLGDDTMVIPGKTYDEELTVKNSGTIDTYVRVILSKYWLNADGERTTEADPAYIQLTRGSSKWLKDEDASGDEREIYYYTDIVASEATTEALITELTIDPQISKELIRTENADNIITYVYKYDGYTFVVEAEAQAVQTHNAESAIKSAWGVDVTITDGSLSF